MSMEGLPDREIIERVRAGHRDEFAELVRRHHARVLGLCVSMLGDEALAEDAAQEAFLKAYASLEGFRSDASFSTWLYRIAANRCLDLRRLRSRRPAESLDALVEQESPRLRSLLGDPGRGKAAEAADLVRRVLDALPEDYRLILTLREMQGLDYKELMEALDCSMDSVKARLRRARLSFQEKLRHITEADGV
jgi:RNA polymerase sigma-70 factor (ECF subfamily)